MTESLMQCYREVQQVATEYKQAHPDDERIFTAEELETLLNNHGIKLDSQFQLADLCYNHVAKPHDKRDYDLSFDAIPHAFLYMGYNQYKIVGADYPYTGPVDRWKGKKEHIIVGHLKDGKVEDWDRDAYLA